MRGDFSGSGQRSLKALLSQRGVGGAEAVLVPAAYRIRSKLVSLGRISAASRLRLGWVSRRG